MYVEMSVHKYKLPMGGCYIVVSLRTVEQRYVVFVGAQAKTTNLNYKLRPICLMPSKPEKSKFGGPSTQKRVNTERLSNQILEGPVSSKSEDWKI